ncbi:YkvA family protein [Arenimonas caeni]|jgi:hypothetical protein|uniref:YkvA family protein n=1 Tax=Arenimonas caeni TaxID=2058085 RepID=UPI002A362D58|nr:YkvA family protein [Arenimonas caeni]MDY0022794.1 YkvA family protein [Arenimonas caeni]
MYANAETFPALPAALARIPAPGPARRSKIGPCALQARELDRFNGLLAELGRPDPLAGDQIVTAARDLYDPRLGDIQSPCISVRLAHAAPLDQFVLDEGWAPAGQALAAARAVLAYLRRPDDLIPDWVPQVGRLDDAIVVDVAWSRIGDELAGYRDFCRLRLLESRLRGEPPGRFRFGRGEWIEARRAESGLREHQRRVLSSSYLPAPASRFRVH